MKEQLDKLNVTEQTQVRNIIVKYKAPVTEAPNGVFVSSEHLPAECLQEMDQYINYCVDQRKRMDDDMKTRKVYERMIE